MELTWLRKLHWSKASRKFTLALQSNHGTTKYPRTSLISRECWLRIWVSTTQSMMFARCSTGTSPCTTTSVASCRSSTWATLGLQSKRISTYSCRCRLCLLSSRCTTCWVRIISSESFFMKCAKLLSSDPEERRTKMTLSYLRKVWSSCLQNLTRNHLKGKRNPTQS